MSLIASPSSFFVALHSTCCVHWWILSSPQGENSHDDDSLPDLEGAEGRANVFKVHSREEEAAWIFS